MVPSPDELKLSVWLYDSDSSWSGYTYLDASGTHAIALPTSNPTLDRSDIRQITVQIEPTNPIDATEDTFSLRLMDISAASTDGEGVLYVSSVDPDCEGRSPCFSTIQAAVDSSSEGNTVRVQAGTYSEVVRIASKNSLVVEGDPASAPGSAVIQPPDRGLAECALGTAAVEIASSNGIALRRLSIHGFDGTGVRLRGGPEASNGVAIVGMQIMGTGTPQCGAGVLVEALNSDTLLAHNVIHANAHDGVVFRGSASLQTAVAQHL